MKSINKWAPQVQNQAEVENHVIICIKKNKHSSSYESLLHKAFMYAIMFFSTLKICFVYTVNIHFIIL